MNKGIATIGKFGGVVGAALLSVAIVGGAAQAGTEILEADVQLAQAEAKPKPKKDPGATLYLRMTCLACHGKDGKMAIMDYPNVAGQDEKYMAAQMQDIISGKRTGSPDATGNPRSHGMQGALVDAQGNARIDKEQINQIVKWLAGLPPAAPALPPEGVDAERVKQGEELYKKNKCMTCHGKDGAKPQKTYPFVAGQKRSYIIAQVKDIRDGARSNGKSKMMQAQTKRLKDDEIELIADYLSQIDRTAN